MNAPHSESEKNAMEVVEKFCKSLGGTWSIIREAEKPLLKELLLSTWKQSAEAQTRRLVPTVDKRGKPLTYIYPDFDVIYPSTETLPGEDKK
jgi:hypothetical protein